MATKDCIEENKRQVPLMKVVKSAITDTWGNISELQQLYSHWAARGLRKLQTEVLKVGKRKVLLQVNKNTMTATLPLDFGGDLFVGHINSNYQRVPLKLSTKIVDACNIEEVEYEDKCTSCGQDKTICEDLQVTEDVTLVVINGTTYENTVIKKLYPNGDYYLEKNIWTLDISDNSVNLNTTKELITNFGLKPCGCLETTEDNISLLKTHCYDCYSCNYSSCCNEPSDYGYAIFEDTGVIQLNFRYPYDTVYLEYLGFMAKKNGQYMVPEIAFETLVEWTKWKAIKDKKGAERWRIKDTWDDYVRERKTLRKMLSRVSLEQIISAARRTPKFNLEYNESWYSCFDPNAAQSVLSGASGGSTSSGGNTTIVNNYPTTIVNNASYQLSVKTGNGAGHPVEGASTYQNNILKGATDLNFIFLAKQTLTISDGDFTFNSITGTITLTSMTFFEPDSLIIPYNKTT